jgi:hypothetical protein
VVLGTKADLKGRLNWGKLATVLHLCVSCVKHEEWKTQTYKGICCFMWMAEGRGVHRVLVGKPEGKRPLGRRRRRWEDNIKLDLREMGIDEANWIQLAQDRVQ